MDEIEPKVLAEIRNIRMLIGRNVLVFQNVVRILKLIHQFRNGNGTFENLFKRKDKIDELPLGRLRPQLALAILKQLQNVLKLNSNWSFYATTIVIKSKLSV